MLLIDEADYVLLDMTYKPDTKFKYVVGLTASPLSNKDGAEEKLLCKQSYKICDSKVAPTFDADLTLQMCSTAQFLRQSNEAAKLVYTRDEEVVAQVKQMGEDAKLTVRCDITEMGALRSLTPNDLLIITKPLLLRGFDYKSSVPDGGINLLLMSPVSSRRALL